MSCDAEMYRLIKENNEMLKRMCLWLDKIESTEYQMNEDLKNLAINLIADMSTSNMTNNHQNFKR